MPAFNIRTLLIVAAFFSLSACEEVVDLPFDIEPTIEIKSHLSETGLVAQVLMANTEADDQSNEYIDDAVVKVYDADDLLHVLELFKDEGGLPCFKTKNWMPEFDKEYTLVVEVEGFKTVTAKTIAPKPVNIEEAHFDPTLTSDDASEIVNVQFDVSFNINDPALTANYYHLSFYQELYDYTFDSNGSPVVLNNSVELARIFINEVDETGPAERYKNSDFLFSDESFNGQVLRLSFEGSFEYNKSKKQPGQFFVELRTVSEDYYKSKKSEQNLPWSDDDIVKGDVIFNNTNNGVGTFTGFTSNKNRFNLQG